MLFFPLPFTLSPFPFDLMPFQGVFLLAGVPVLVSPLRMLPFVLPDFVLPLLVFPRLVLPPMLLLPLLELPLGLFVLPGVAGVVVVPRVFVLSAVEVEPVAPAPDAAPVGLVAFVLPGVPPTAFTLLLPFMLLALSVAAQAAPKVARAARLKRAKVRRIEVSPVLAEARVINNRALVSERPCSNSRAHEQSCFQVQERLTHAILAPDLDARF
jgi:hypothetical protein